MFACNNNSAIPSNLLEGKWKVAFLIRGQDTIEMDYSPIYFEFNSNKRYVFQSTLNTREAGRYYTQGNRLLTTDTLVDSPKEKAVLVKKITQDSMIYIMNLRGERQAMYLYKSK